MQNQIYFIDSKLNDYQAIINSLSSTDLYYIIDSTKDGLTQISNTLLNYSNLDSIHIYSHGDIGSLNIGNTIYDNTNISNYKIELENIGKSLSSTGDILLYGCNVGQDEVGLNFINQIAQFSQADVAASDDLTGNKVLGGDWDLEVKSGVVESEVKVIDDYELTFSIMTATSIKNGQIINFDGTSVDNYYSFTMIKEGNILVSGSDSNSYAMNLQIFDADFNYVDYYIGNSSESITLSNAGTYYVQAIDEYGGSFSISSTAMSGVPMTATSIKNGQIINFDGTSVDNYYSFTMIKEGNILVSGSDSNSYAMNLQIFDADFNYVDYYIGNSSESITLSNAGTYYVQAIDEYGGSFSISSTAMSSNSTPTITSTTIGKVAENSALSTVIYKVTATDPDANTTLKYSLSGTDASLLNINSTTGNVTLKKSADYETKKSYSFNVIASDGSLSATKAVTVNVTNVNEFAPTSANKIITINEDSKKVLSLSDFVFKDSDADSSLSKVKITQLETKGNLKLNGKDVILNQEILASDIKAGKLVFTPISNEFGTSYTNFKFQVSDGTKYSTSSYTTTFNVTQVIDTVSKTTSYTLPSLIENLTLTGIANINGTGNSLNNTITGNSANNILNGKSGNDKLNGGAGADTLYGELGNDILNGGIGADIMLGGAGNDTYYVDNVGDKVYETKTTSSTSGDAGGIDKVNSSISYTLTSFVENLSLTGSSNINGTGNSLNNKITGNSAANKLTGGAGNDILDGKAGIDTMIGGTGNDTYYVDNVKDVVTELASQGTDLVNSSITYTLGANVENLILTGTAAINGIGNSLNNVINGNTGNNILNGGAGNDTLKGGLGNDILYGGTGKDTFVFNTKLNASTNKDTIKDFNVADDTISLENAIFTKLTATGILNKDFFKVTTDGKATDSNDYIVYNKTNGQLLYDADGNGSGASVLFAVVENKANLTNADFTVI